MNQKDIDNIRISFDSAQMEDVITRKAETAQNATKKSLNDAVAKILNRAPFGKFHPTVVYYWPDGIAGSKKEEKTLPRFELGVILLPTRIYTGNIYVSGAAVQQLTWPQYAAHLRLITLEILLAIAKKHQLDPTLIQRLIDETPAPTGQSPFYDNPPRIGRARKDPDEPTVDVELVFTLRSRTWKASRAELVWIQAFDLELYERLEEEGLGELSRESGRGSTEMSILGRRSRSIMALVKRVLSDLGLKLPPGSHFLVSKIDSDEPPERIELEPKYIGDPSEWSPQEKPRSGVRKQGR